jgi:hypothetical protein
MTPTLKPGQVHKPAGSIPISRPTRDRIRLCRKRWAEKNPGCACNSDFVISRALSDSPFIREILKD